MEDFRIAQRWQVGGFPFYLVPSNKMALARLRKLAGRPGLTEGLMFGTKGVPKLLAYVTQLSLEGFTIKIYGPEVGIDGINVEIR